MDDNNDTCKTANIKHFMSINLLPNTHERLFNESTRPHMLASYLSVYVLLIH
jgi:hypothetical protein